MTQYLLPICCGLFALAVLVSILAMARMATKSERMNEEMKDYNDALR